MVGIIQKQATRPFLRWAGSKRKVLPYLKRFVPPQFNRYIEPFAGSACLFFDLQPKHAILSDLNRELIDTYRTVRNDPQLVGRTLAKLPVGREAYYKIRFLKIDKMSAVQRAARFIYLNRFCFNGLYRTNTKGDFNVPYGAPKTTNVPTAESLDLCSILLRRATLTSGDFEEVIRSRLQRGDFIYLDPPFFQNSRRVFREYNPVPFQATDLKRLSRLLHAIDKAGANFVLSYSACAEAKIAFKGWHTTQIRTTRNISGFTKHRRVATEIVITNFTNVLNQ